MHTDDWNTKKNIINALKRFGHSPMAGGFTSSQKEQKKHRGDGVLQARGLSISSDPGKSVNDSQARSGKSEETMRPKRRMGGGGSEGTAPEDAWRGTPTLGLENLSFGLLGSGEPWKVLEPQSDIGRALLLEHLPPGVCGAEGSDESLEGQLESYGAPVRRAEDPD